MITRAPMTGALIAKKGQAASGAPASAARGAEPAPAKKSAAAERQPVLIRLDPDLYERLRLRAFETKKSQQEIMVTALEAHLLKG